MERSALLKTSKSETSTPPVSEEAKTILRAETVTPAQEVKVSSSEPEPEESSNGNGPAKVAVSREETSNPN